MRERYNSDNRAYLASAQDVFESPQDKNMKKEV
jgi:hypothetical protein